MADALILAGDAAEELERHGFVAVGKLEMGVARVEFWAREGARIASFRYEVTPDDASTRHVVEQCLALARQHLKTFPARTLS